ncbi:hypothetical protein PQX77_006946, partial [Marasmius sp. AFHP31]
AFKEDFRKFSRERSFKSSAQVFAVDVGAVPSLFFWHGLLPISHFRRNSGWLGGIYVYTLCRKLKCSERELWVDSRRGVFCQGPEGPESDIGGMRNQVEVENLPLTAEMLQEDVFLRFLASQKSKQADQLFLSVYAVWWGSYDDDEGVPESCDQPTISSTSTKTPIAVANNVWTSGLCSTERKALENGLTRFRLEEDGNGLLLFLNSNVRLAWLFQSSNIFQSCGISLDDDPSVYKLVYRRAWLDGYLDKSPSKSRRRHQQPIYLFVDSSHPDLFNGKTSRLHFWSFHEDGQHRLSPKSCLHFGLPIELELSHVCNRSWKTNNYKSIHQYQQLRGFDPTTTDFAQHLGYGYIFQPIHHSDRFMEVDQEHSNSLDASVTSNSTECLSDMMDQPLAEDPTSMTSNQDQINSREDGPTINSHCVTNKRQKRNTGYEGIERNNPEPDLRHKNDPTNDHDLAIDGQKSRLMQPLPTRFRPFPFPTSYYHTNQPPYPYPSCPAYPSLEDTVPFASRAENMGFPTTSNLSSSHLESQGWTELSPNTVAATYFDTLPPFHAYDSADVANSASGLTRSTMDLGYTASDAYSGVSTTANASRYDLGATQNTGWSGASQVETSAPVNMLYNSTAYPATSYSTPAVTHLSNPAYSVNFTYSPHSATPTSHAHGPGYPSLFPSYDGGSFAPQQPWNPPVAHHGPSYNLPSFSFPGVTYPSNSTVHIQTHLPYSAHTPQGHPSMFPSNGGNPLVLHQPWNMPADHPQQPTYEASMQSTQWNPWNETSGEYGQGDGSSGWQ